MGNTPTHSPETNDNRISVNQTAEFKKLADEMMAEMKKRDDIIAKSLLIIDDLQAQLDEQNKQLEVAKNIILNGQTLIVEKDAEIARLTAKN